MSTPIFVFLVLTMLGSGVVLAVNLAGNGRALYDYWSLDNDDDTPTSRLDILRSAPVFYVSGVLLVGSVGICLWLLHGK